MSYREDDYLFRTGELEPLLNAMRSIGAQEEVDKIPKDQFLSNNVDDIVAHISTRLKVVPLRIYEESKTMEQTEVKIDVTNYPNRNVFGDPGPIMVPGIRVTVSIPFSGTDDLWQLRPNTFRTIYPRGRTTPPNSDGVGSLDIIIEQPNDEDPNRIKERLNSVLDDIRFYVKQQNEQIDRHNASIESIIRGHVEARKDRIRQHDKLTDLLEIPLKKDNRAPAIKPLEIRQIVQPLCPPPKSGYKPEPGITPEIYEYILSVIRHEGRTFETTPKTFSIHDEEGLRDILLAHLNGHLKGAATGETFRKSGKTDIKIEAEDRAAFISECKVWKGEKEIPEAVDQLLSYLTWRDCKAALIIFNKHNIKFSELIQTIPAALKTHPKIKKYIGQPGEGEWDFVFMSQEDEGRFVQIRVFVFNIYCKTDKK